MRQWGAKVSDALAWTMFDKARQAKKVNRLRATVKWTIKYGYVSRDARDFCERALRATDDRRKR